MRTVDRRHRSEYRDDQVTRDIVERLSPSAANQILASTAADQAAWTATPTLTTLTVTTIELGSTSTTLSEATAGALAVEGNTVPSIASVVAEDLIVGSGAQTWKRLAVGSNGQAVITSSGAVAWGAPDVPADGVAFLAFNSVTDTAQTGDGTAATVDFDTEVYDRGADFATDTFTAANTGLHQFNAQVTLIDLDQAAFTGVFLRIATSNRNYTFEWDMSQNAAGAATDQFSFSASVLADMDAADTATVVIDISGGTKTVDVLGHATTLYTFFSGHQVTNS